MKLKTLTQDMATAIASKAVVEGAKPLEWWRRQAEETRRRFADSVRVSLRRGETLQQATARLIGGKVGGVQIKGFMRATRAQAAALVATSAAAVISEARLAVFRRNTHIIKEIQQISVLDNRTSPQCLAYAGKRWDIDTLNPIGHTLPYAGGTPRHFRCRSTIQPVAKAWDELDPETQQEAVARGITDWDGEIAKPITVDQWLRRKTVAEQNALLGATKARLWRANKLTLQQLVDFSGNPLTVAQLLKLVNNP